MRKICALIFGSLMSFNSFADSLNPETQFLSAIQMAVYEENNLLLDRSQKIVRDRFDHGIVSFPGLENVRYEIKSNGNELVFLLTSNDDIRDPLQNAVSEIIGQLNGRVRARGRSMFYKTALSQPLGGYLEVVVDDSHTKVISVLAQAVPLRDLLKELKNQLGGFSYLMPGECADRMIDWGFGEFGSNIEPKTIDNVMIELATLFNLKLDKKSGSYIFSGQCNEIHRAQHIRSEGFKTHFLPINHSISPQVFVPLMPLRD
ncbi:MAG: hypothetical protein EBR01_07895 [Proteobacteria bacterium]|nr:hypothetical protein [Pseudomonadota bacterium]NBY20943.1 hypothetical protein [bacterium]